MFYLYKITNQFNQKVYIGQSNKETERWRQHKYFSRQEKPLQYIHRAMAKYGIENFIYEVIAMCKESAAADELESQLIIQYQSIDKKFGYNRAPGGNVAWQSGLPSYMYPMYGKHHSEESKNKSSISNTGIKKPHSEEWKIKVSKSLKGRRLSEDNKRKIKASNKFSNVGKKHSDETKQKMSKSKLKWTEDKYREIIRLYQTGLSPVKVSIIMKCTAMTVRNILKRYNIKIRSYKEAIKIKYELSILQ